MLLVPACAGQRPLPAVLLFNRWPLLLQVLLMTIQNPPPTLEQDSGKKHFSKYMRDVVAKCLVKDPAKRPTAAQLLEHKFFKVRSPSVATAL